MKLQLCYLVLCLLMLVGCDQQAQKLFWIDPPDQETNDFIYMVESVNVSPIDIDSMGYYLTAKEMSASPTWTYKDYGLIHSTDNYDVRILLKIKEAHGRHYHFILRTYSKSFQIIDSHEMASWVEEEGFYCYGSIDKELIIKRNCRNETEVHQITEEGKIVVLSDHVSSSL